VPNETTLLRTLDLPCGGIVPVAIVPGEQVHVVYGLVSLTLNTAGPGHQETLAGGDEVRLDRDGLAVIEALGPARVQLYEPSRRASPLQRLAGQARRRFAAWLQRRPELSGSRAD
jgi:hypothetical protein